MKKKVVRTSANSISREQRIETFAQAVVANKSQSDAYRLAYPASLKWKSDTVHSKASTMAADGKVRKRIQELKDAQLEAHGASIDRVLQELSRIAFLDTRKFYGPDGKLLPVHELPEDISAALAEFSVVEVGEGIRTSKVKAASKLGAIELMGKWFKMWTDKHEVTGKDGAPIEHQMSVDMPIEELQRRYKEFKG